MSEPYVGEIRMFGAPWAPVNWVLCDGRALPIAEYEALFSLVGTTYGGDGVNTFNVPDLRGRIPIGQGTGPGLSPRVIGATPGSATVTLTQAQMPSHNHALLALAAAPTATAPGPSVALAEIPASGGTLYTQTATATTALAAASVAAAGDAPVPYDNLMPSLCVNYIIAVNGLYPSQ